MTGIIIWAVLIILAIFLLWMIINFKMTQGRGNFAATTVFTEMQNEDKRNAMEIVIEEKAGNIKYEDESGEDKDPEEHS